MLDMTRKKVAWVIPLALMSLLMISQEASAVPSFARQTGEACVACHVSFPELTPFGRLFKLNGYTTGSRRLLPVAVMAQAGVTSIGNSRDDQGNVAFPKNRDLAFSGGSLFLAGKATDNLGGFLQWTYDNLNVNSDGSLGGHSGIDNADLRLVGRSGAIDAKEIEWIYGLTVHNNPTVQDVWNSTPAFGFPYTGPPNAISPAAGTLIDGGLAQQVAGLGGYVFWKKMLYGELSLYRTADGPFSILRAGQDTANPGGVSRLKGYNPYWRFALNHEWGPHSVMVGTYGMQVDKYPDNTLSDTPTDRFTDYALDAQYQYIADPHTFTAQTTVIREKQDYRASSPATQAGTPIGAGPTPNNAVDHLRTFKLKGSYYSQRKYGATLAYFSTTGDTDAGLYGPASVGGSNNGSPDSNGYIVEADYLPIPNLRLMVQYTGYRKFNGARDNYDGAGRSAKDNNTLFLNVWLAY
jgi:hypothetical protein